MEEKTNQLDEDNRATGVWRYYYMSGCKMGEGLYLKGRRVGIWTWFKNCVENTTEELVTEEEIYII